MYVSKLLRTVVCLGSFIVSEMRNNKKSWLTEAGIIGRFHFVVGDCVT